MGTYGLEPQIPIRDPSAPVSRRRSPPPAGPASPAPRSGRPHADPAFGLPRHAPARSPTTRGSSRTSRASPPRENRTEECDEDETTHPEIRRRHTGDRPARARRCRRTRRRCDIRRVGRPGPAGEHRCRGRRRRRPGHLLAGHRLDVPPGRPGRSRPQHEHRRRRSQAAPGLGRAQSDAGRAGQRGRDELQDHRRSGDLHLRARLGEHRPDPLPGHPGQIRPARRHRQQQGARRAARRTRRRDRGRLDDQPRPRRDPDREQRQRAVYGGQGRRRRSGELLGERQQRAAAMDPGRSRRLGRGEQGGARAARRVGAPDPDPLPPGQHRRDDLHRHPRLGRSRLRPGERQHRHARVRHGDHPVPAGRGDRQHRMARRPGGRVRGLRPDHGRHPGTHGADRTGLHPTGRRPDPAHLGRRDRQRGGRRLRRVRRRCAAQQRRRRHARIHRQPAGHRDGDLSRGRPGRRRQQVAEQQPGDPYRIRWRHRHEPGRRQADHRVLHDAALRRHERHRRQREHVLGGQHLPEHADRGAGFERGRPSRGGPTRPGSDMGPAYPDHRGARSGTERGRLHHLGAGGRTRLRAGLRRQHREHPGHRPGRRPAPADHHQLRCAGRSSRGIPGDRRTRAQPRPDRHRADREPRRTGGDRRDHAVRDGEEHRPGCRRRHRRELPTR